MSIENPTIETTNESEAGSEKYQKVMRLIGSIKYMASLEDPRDFKDNLKEVGDYAEQLEAAVKELKEEQSTHF